MKQIILIIIRRIQNSKFEGQNWGKKWIWSARTTIFIHMEVIKCHHKPFYSKKLQGIIIISHSGQSFVIFHFSQPWIIYLKKYYLRFIFDDLYKYNNKLFKTDLVKKIKFHKFGVLWNKKKWTCRWSVLLWGTINCHTYECHYIATTTIRRLETSRSLPERLQSSCTCYMLVVIEHVSCPMRPTCKFVFPF